MNGASCRAPGAVRGVVKTILICGIAAAAMLIAPAVAQAQTQTQTPPAIPDAYRALGASHLYGLYGDRVFKGQLPPLLYAIAIVETEIDEEGNVVSAVVTREPASAKDVMPWILGLIKAASPFPKPGLAGRTRYQDVWLVDRGYTFQLHTLTEGQRWNE
jgi:periplasmic protein TonB